MQGGAGDPTDRKLLDLLRHNARLPVTSLSHQLGLSRASVHARIARLEKAGVIDGYTIRLGAGYVQSQIRAHVMLKLLPKHARQVEEQLTASPGVFAIHAISGEYDMIAMIESGDVAELNRNIDAIGEIEGVVRTTSSILLDTKFLR